jgi:hypothetical protein
MDRFAEQAHDGFQAVGGNYMYMSYALSAQHELFQLGMNLFQRELETGRKIAACRDMSQALAVFNHLMKETAEDFSAATSRLLHHASAMGANSLQETEQRVRAAGETAQAASEAAAQTVTETEAKPRRTAAHSARPRRRVRK